MRSLSLSSLGDVLVALQPLEQTTFRTWSTFSLSLLYSLLASMAPKTLGGAGKKSAQDYVAGLWQHGLSEQQVRQQLKDDGYKAGRISQLVKATRPAAGQAGVGAEAAVPEEVMRRPAAALGEDVAEVRVG